MNGDMAQKNHLHEIDILYAMGTILAVLGHSHPVDWNTFPGKWVDFIYYFHMPLFFLIAGFLLAGSRSFERQNYCKWLSGKALRLLTPYFVLSALSLVPKYILEHGNLSSMTPEYVFRSFFVPRQNVWGHFWFLPVLFFLYSVFGFLRKSGAMQRTAGKLVVFALTAALHFLNIGISLLGIEDFCEFAVFFCTGYIVYGLYINNKVKLSVGTYLMIIISSLVVSIALYSFLTGSWYRDLSITVLMLVCCLSFGLCLKNCRTSALDYISHHVFTFYIYSWFAQAIAERVCSNFRMPWIAVTSIMFAAGLCFPALICVLYDRMRFLHCRFVDLVLGIRK